MKKKDAAQLAKLLLTPVMMILLGIVLMVRPDSASALVGRIVGWILILLGGGLIISALRTKDTLAGKIFFAAVALAAGVWLVRNPLRMAAAIGRIAGLLILIRGVQDIINASRWKCGMRYALISAIVGAVLIVLPMTTSRAVWVIVGLLVMVLLGVLVTFLGVLMALDRLKPGKLLSDGGNIIDSQ